MTEAEKPLFKISNLECSYSKEHTESVLNIEELSIPKNKLVFILGASGAGKSTLLETLGLMNKTITKGEITLFNESNHGIPFSGLWNNNKETELNQVRRKYYSFIFQNTNLMENFTAYENISLAEMIKSGTALSETTANVTELLNKVKLPSNEVNQSTLANNLSGGQRQRLSFVRAFSTKPLVLFGDEPTGNLDEENSRELFKLIKDRIGQGTTAIIVSHNLDIAMEFADKIIVITKDTHKGYGEVLPENIYDRDAWEKLSHEGKYEFRQKLRSYYSSNLDNKIDAQKDGELRRIRNLQQKKISFRTLFFLREFKALADRGFTNFFILSFLLFATFLAIGFANGSLDYLEKKLNNPFVEWLSISIPYVKGYVETDKIKNELDNAGLKNKYSYLTVTAYHNISLELEDYSTSNPKFCDGRTFEPDDDEEFIKEFVFKPDNVLHAKDNGFRTNKDIGIIVTKDLLDELNYPENAQYITLKGLNIDSTSGSIKYYPVQIPIRAIVKKLPGTAQLGVTEYFFNAWKSSSEDYFDFRNNLYLLKIFCETDSINADKLYKVIEKVINNPNVSSRFNIQQPIKPVWHTDTWGKGYDIVVKFMKPATDKKNDSLFNVINNDESVRKLKIHLEPVNDYSGISYEGVRKFDYDALSIYFKDLSKVRKFADYVENRYNEKNDPNPIKADQSAIIDKENYNFLSLIASIISYLVIVLGTIGVCLFLFNLLKRHLNKVKMNIGTYKAIGLGDRESLTIYFSIIITFLIAGIIFSMVFAELAGKALNWFMNGSSYIAVEKADYFSLLKTNTYIALLIIFFIGLISSFFVIKRILAKSPGDLIYNR